MREEEISKAPEALWFGLFPADESSLEFLRAAATLGKPVEFPHVTFGYKVEPPAGIDWEEVYDVEVIGYGNDGRNEGYAVSFPEDLDDVYHGAETPHITLSTSVDGSPVDTAFIDFEKLEAFSVPMKFGFYRKGKYHV